MKQNYIDGFAVALSGVCAIHCIVVPVIAGLFPLVSSIFFHDPHLHQFWFHRFILIFILPASLLAFYFGYLAHHKISVVLGGLVGLFILSFLAIFAHTLIEQQLLSVIGERFLTLLGGFVHAASHFFNMYYCRAGKQCAVTG